MMTGQGCRGKATGKVVMPNRLAFNLMSELPKTETNGPPASNCMRKVTVSVIIRALGGLGPARETLAPQRCSASNRAAKGSRARRSAPRDQGSAWPPVDCGSRPPGSVRRQTTSGYQVFCRRMARSWHVHADEREIIFPIAQIRHVRCRSCRIVDMQYDPGMLPRELQQDLWEYRRG